MTVRQWSRFSALRAQVQRALHGPHVLAFIPAIALAAFWIGGEALLVATALGAPLLYMIAGGGPPAQDIMAAGPGDIVNTITATNLAQAAVDSARDATLSTACLLIEVDGLTEIGQRAGENAADAFRDLTLSRLRNALRRDDTAVRIGDARYMVLLAPSLRLDIEALLYLSTRIQNALEEPASIDNAMRYLAASIGFCGSSRLKDEATGKHLLEAAQIALTEAIANGPSAIRSWSENMRSAHKQQKSLQSEVERALSNGQIQPWFQPQICTSTGRISGVEALARWIHPERGIVPPAQFLCVLEEAGKMEQLSEVILQHALTALRSWDQAGLDVPRVSVNFADAELRDPKLVQRIQWELDRFGLTAQRLGIEVLETVIAASPEGIVARNIVELGRIGCQIDLDDFGIGHASITSLRRFTVHRLKIDRSFITRVDRDEDQQRMLAAVLGMADRLGLETLAEGVESVGEHALLAQLGCDHVQGFGIARPMPADQMIRWAQDHAARISRAQKLGRSTG
ncbi:putative bifunctional diguanylate cyclase/phosphodiesterase [Ponticoccus alexandrii]|uniref:EAL domain-containing protein n=1 Tax=Ponticoccus alexandrii TaxID=1943633 RepID=A0ABX7FCI0_9RHOB|nr:GGDEF domain-containing phosphodiesterase [Ponticoccus alexandrii]ETA51235.1 diguanylate cyclase [Rhodobacteraceae bacterium PD-2]QRF67811.1 EAL domain-containing protein [Ponticoccus alexandrii]